MVLQRGARRGAWILFALLLREQNSLARAQPIPIEIRWERTQHTQSFDPVLFRRSIQTNARAQNTTECAKWVPKNNPRVLSAALGDGSAPC